MPKGTLVALSDYPEDFITCRDLMHAWKIVAWYREDHEVRRVLECQRCHSERHDRWGPRSGERLGSSYAYEDGYQVPGGVDRADVRLAQMKGAQIFPSWSKAEESLNKRRGRK